MPASTTWAGVGMSGWPMPRLITSRPCGRQGLGAGEHREGVLLADPREGRDHVQHRALRAGDVRRGQCLVRSDSFIAPNDIATAIAPRITKVFIEA